MTYLNINSYIILTQCHNYWMYITIIILYTYSSSFTYLCSIVWYFYVNILLWSSQ